MITFHSGSFSITLPSPRLGDSEQLDIKTNYLMTMDNAVHSYVRTPTNSKLLLTFEDLTDLQYSNLITFLENTVNSTIEYVDYDSVTWHGVIVNTTPVIETYGRRPCTTGEQEVHRVTIEFESGPPLVP